jgi:HAD superfamily hydrolase (TIGR01509 family)
MTLAPKAILFDCDGTLLLTADLHFQAIRAATQAQGVALSRDWYMGLTGLGRKDLFAELARAQAVVLDLPRLVDDSIAETVALAALARPNPPVAALARRCAGRLPIAVATNSERPVVTALLGATGMFDLFDCVVSLDDVAAAKPAPDMFLLGAQRLGIAPADCLVLEDSAQGLAAARAAGMAAIDVREPDAPARLAALMPEASEAL